MGPEFARLRRSNVFDSKSIPRLAAKRIGQSSQSFNSSAETPVTPVLTNVKLRDRYFPLLDLGAAPAALVVQRHPAAFCFPVVPILVELEVDEQPVRLQHVENAVVVGPLLVEISGRALPHLGIDLVQFEQESVDAVFHRL